MTDAFSQLLAAEEAKRERNWDPALRWQVIQETIRWAEAQRTVRRNTPAACLAEQQRKLAAFRLQEARTAAPPAMEQ